MILLNSTHPLTPAHLNLTKTPSCAILMQDVEVRQDGSKPGG